MAKTYNRSVAKTDNRLLWMVAIVALLGALAFVGLRSGSQAPAAVAPAAPTSSALAPIAPTILQSGPLGPFASGSETELAPAGPADWSMEGLDAGRTREARTVLTLPLTRQRTVPTAADREVGSPPTVARGLMLIDTKDALRAFDVRSGRERWAFANPGSYVSPAVAGDQAFLRAEAANNGKLVALDLLSGAVNWTFTPKRFSSESTDYFGGHLGSPVIVDGAVFVGAGKELYAVSEQTGEQRWVFAAQDFVTSSATVAGGRVFISDFKFVYAVDQQTGELLWSYPAAGAISFSPVASDRVALVMSGDEVVALDGASGRKLWTLSVTGEKLIPAAMNADTAFVKSTESLYAVRLSDGKELWRYHAPNFISLPALAGSQAFVVSGMGADTAVVALDAGSGASVWKQPVRSLATTAPVIAGGALYVRMEDGRVLGLWN